jgi:hypothetical protein
LPHPGRRRSEDHQAQDRPERIPVDYMVRDHGDHRVEFSQGQEL